MTSGFGGDWLRGVLFGCVLIACAGQARAEVVPDLYAVSVPVAEQSPGELQRAAAAGLRELAVRISGRSGAANEPAMAASFANAAHYLEQYRYERSASGESPWLAQLRFAPAAIDAELRKSGLPVWGGNRPSLVAIVAIEDKGARTVIDEQSPFATALREQWRRRGLLLHLPSNASAVNIDDVMRLDNAKIGASLQERADGFVLGKIVLTSNGTCDSRWLLNVGAQKDTNAQPFNADATGSALNICVANALDRIVDNLSAPYAIAANSTAEGILLRVIGVASFEDYSTLLNYLRRLAVIKSVQPMLVSGDEILFQLRVAGSTEQLARQLALENRLSSTDNPVNKQSVNASAPVVALSYRWAAVRN